MARDQIIAHLSLLGWELRAYYRGPVEFRLVNPRLGHNVTDWTDGETGSRYHRVWAQAPVDHLWPVADWALLPDKMLWEMLAVVEAEK